MPRLGYALGFLACAGLIGFALYLQYYEYQDPCPLCILQRVAFMALGAIFLVAAVHGPARAGVIVYGGLLFVVAAAGAAIATRHVWLQHLPRHQAPECGPGLEYMLEKFPLSQAIGKILAGSGECAETGWAFLGLSIAGWSLAWLVLLAIFSVYLTVTGARAGGEARALHS
jgi:disulfide bond formation protein DsbB